MVGIYFHIPFCKQRCIYCDFFSTCSVEVQDQYTHAMIRELELRSINVSSPVVSIYFGGGTPSQLSIENLKTLFCAIKKYYTLSSNIEITLEANPDDLDDLYLSRLSNTPVNRLSIGIQSFDDNLLKLLNRRHNSVQAVESVKRAREYGFKNISIDLMYGLPGLTNEIWEQTLKAAISLEVEHLSAYHLTIEEGTSMHQLIEQKRILIPDEQEGLSHMALLFGHLHQAGYIQYEISNFSLPDKQAIHNGNYWKRKPYIGIGAGAHSFDGEYTRRWNVSDLSTYINGIDQNNETYFEQEYISAEECLNEIIMVELRCMKGIDMKALQKRCGSHFQTIIEKDSTPFIKKGLLTLENGYLRLTPKGIPLCDMIIRDLIQI